MKNSLLLLAWLTGLGGLAPLNIPIAHAQTPSITPATDGTGTTVTTQGNRFDIGGGRSSVDGANLFQSFDRFSLNQGEIANFLAAPTVRNILGRVVGGDPSTLNGLIQVTGGAANLYLLNPAGIVFGANARLNVPASFTATTANGIGFGNGQWFSAIGTADYAALIGTPNTFAFTNLQPGAIVNLGNLAVGQGQSLTLLGGTVLNTGQLTAPGGQITLAAVPGQTLVRLSQQGSLLSLEFSPLRTQAPLSDASTPPTLPQLLTGGNLGNATGITVNPDGTLQLTGSTVQLSTTPGSAIVSGQVSVAHSSPTPDSPLPTPQIAVLGDRVSLQAATLDASGLNGGTLRVGGSYQGQGTVPNARFTDVDANTIIRADAIAPIGNGGTVIAWSNNTTTVAGTITAKGGVNGGNGGFVETSGKQTLDFTGARVNASAPNGQPGTWLLDPSDITIDPMLAPFINTSLNGGTSVNLTTVGGTGGNGDILLQSSINKTNNNLASLTLTASRYITPSGGATINLASGNLTLNVNQEGLAVTTNPTIQNAIAAIGTVATIPTINLGAGTYTLANTVNIAQSLTLNGTSASTTTVSGNNAVRVFNISGSGTSVTISGLTIANGNQIGSPVGGGGLLNNAGNTLTLNNSIVRNNSSSLGGGGIRSDGTMILNNVTVRDNTNSSSGFGGGIDNVFGGNLTLNNSLVTNNTSPTGGGINNFAGSTLTLNNSTISGNSATSSGGGIYNESSNFVLNNTTISGNAASGGGGIYILSGGAIANSSTITDNTASSFGGGIYTNGSGTVSIANSTLSNNQAASYGGGIYTNGSGTVSITNSTLSNNQASFAGGGIYINGPGMVSITNSALSNNKASSVGGGIFVSSGAALTLSNSTVTGNTAGSYGGGIRNLGTTTISNSTISNNIAQGSNGGAGIDSQGGSSVSSILTLTNSTLSGNVANGSSANAGAIWNDGTATINNVTIFGNTAAGSSSSGGIYNVGGTFTVSNTIVAGNTNASAPDVLGNFIDQGNNLIGKQDGSSGFTVSPLVGTIANPINALLAPLGNYGGTTQTHALLPGSPAIDAGGTSATTTDQRGIAAVGIRDIGAFESRGFTLTVTSGTPQSTLLTLPFANPLVATVNSPFGEPVAGGSITFTAPTSGATATLTPLTASINSAGQASVNAIANAVAGDYTVTATARGVTGSALFSLSNTIPPLTPQPTPQTTLPESERRAVQQESTPTYPTPPKPVAEVGQIARVDRVDTLQTELESSITGQFADHLELKEQPTLKSVPQIQDSLQKIETEAGIKPALFYISLLSSPVATATSEDDNKDPALSYDAAGNPVIRQVPSAEPDLVLIVVPPTGSPILRKVPGVTRSKILKLALTFRNEVADPSKTLTRSYLPSSEKLYSWLIKPIESELKAQGIDTLMFIMDTNLRFLPLAALYDARDRKFLVEKYSVGLLPSLSLTDLRYGNVRTTQVLAAGTSTFADANQNPLLGVNLELATIFKGDRWQGRSIRDQAFTFSNLQQQRQNQPFGIIHLATHGAFLPGKIGESYIQLSNDKLRLNQIRQMGWNNPPAELVVLSACQMALGDDDAELGFAGFAVKAGVKSALASLWNISDEGTIGLMSRFYEELRQVPTKAGALRQAQIAMLKGQVRVEDGKLQYGAAQPLTLPPELAKLSQQRFAHPYYWSAFTMIGSPW